MNDSILRLEYKGWKIVAHHQCEIKPYKPFVAIASKEINNVLTMFNVEGDTIEQACEKINKEIDRRCGT